jgi:hypothetical protein
MQCKALRISALVIALTAFVPAVVYAAWVRVNFRACSYSGSSYNCALQEDDRLGHSTISTLNVHVTDNSASHEVWAVACRQSFEASIGSCGADDSTSVGGTPGQVTLTPSLSAWSNSSGSGYIFVQGLQGSLQGYYAAN